MSDFWLALSIGNSRYHWAGFNGPHLLHTWDCPHPLLADVLALSQLPTLERLRAIAHLPTDWDIPDLPELWLACVVPEHGRAWQGYPQLRLVTLEDIPVKNLYPTLGIDRALNLWGAGNRYGWPVLVIDAGTALTLSGVNQDQSFAGGAILLGVGLQRRSLATGTAALPLIELGPALPPRWGLNTETAIQSGILYPLLAGLRDYIADWWQQYPGSPIVWTGGDRQWLAQSLQTWLPQIGDSPAWLTPMHIDPHLTFWGLQAIRYPQSS